MSHSDKHLFAQEVYNSFYPGKKIRFFDLPGHNSFIRRGELYLSEEIINRLSEPSLKALICHEIGHMIYHHIPINYFLFFLWIILPFVPAAFYPEELVLYAVGTGIGIAILFGWFYHNVIIYQEHQADMFAVKCTDRTIVSRMLFEISNTDLFRSSFGHPSIHQRIDYING